jgi:glycosyltransferase involved in cell wall biosynthesis
MKISVVVPAFNEERLLPATLASIQAATSAFEERGWASELIVCDNNSTDLTAEIALAAGATVVFEAVNQIARARNTGAACAGGDWLVFVDADSQPTRALFDDLAAQIETGCCLAGGSTVTFRTDHLAARFLVTLWNALSRVCRWGAGSLVFCEVAAFREIGGFSQTLYAAEEIDLFSRLKRLAAAKRRTIVILHRHPLATSDRKLRLYGIGEYLAFLMKTSLSAGRALRNRDACFLWYDGRR